MSTSLKNSMLVIALVSSVTLAASAGIDPATKQQASDSAPAVAAMEGFATGTLFQSVDGAGRMIADLMTFDGTRRLVMVADLKADVGGPETASSMSGTLTGYLHSANTPDPWKTTSNLVLLGTWQRTFDTGRFTILVIERDGLSEHVKLAGQIIGSFGADHQITLAPASDAAPASAYSAFNNYNSGGIVGPKPSPGLIAPVLARWILF